MCSIVQRATFKRQVQALRIAVVEEHQGIDCL